MLKVIGLLIIALIITVALMYVLAFVLKVLLNFINKKDAQLKELQRRRTKIESLFDDISYGNYPYIKELGELRYEVSSYFDYEKGLLDG